MLVKDWMSEKLITINVDETVQDAIIRLKENNISKLPVIEGGQLVGIITDRDVRRFWPSATDSYADIKDLVYMALHMKAGTIMTKEPITVPWNYTLQETAEILLDNNISGCPVVDDAHKAIGMVTRNDLFQALISWSGMRKKGIQLGFLSEDRPGCICEIINTIRNHDGRLASIMSSNQDAPEGLRHISVMAYKLDADNVHKIRSELTGRANILYMVDRAHNKREVYTDM